MPPRQNGCRHGFEAQESARGAGEAGLRAAGRGPRALAALLALGAISSVVVLSPLTHRVKIMEDVATDHCALRGSLPDLPPAAAPGAALAPRRCDP